MPAPLHNRLTVTGAAQQLSTAQGTPSALILKAPVTNKNAVYIGGSLLTANNGYAIDPGEIITYEYKGTNLGTPGFEVAPYDIWFIGTAGSGDQICYFASP
jgi:hypothetical protein